MLLFNILNMYMKLVNAVVGSIHKMHFLYLGRGQAPSMTLPQIIMRKSNR